MKLSFKILALFIVFATFGCTQTAKENQEQEDPNKALYNQVMDIHDEVMPRMDELFKLKKQLSEKIVNSPDLVESKKRELENTIYLLDSASRGMMKWMNDFSPEEFSEDDLRIYLEAEMKRMQEVKALMLDALEKGTKANE